MEKLAIVMPVYNEEAAIGPVLDKWVRALDLLGIEYTINPYNDGSKDGSWQVIQAKAEEYPDKVIAHTKPNGGHGPTILQGYREAAEAGYDWVFQIDSDDEMGPEGFSELWSNRENYDFLVGIRDGRKQALPRKIISAVSRLSVRIFYGKSIWDVNTPYRLMRVSAFKEVWNNIPADTFAPNVIISGMAARKEMRCFETRVPQRDRQTGEVSIKKWKLFKAAAKSFWQTVKFAQDKNELFFYICSLISAFFYSLIIFHSPFARCAKLEIDDGVFYTIGKAIRYGLVPYKDMFDHKGPLIYYINALGDYIWGYRGVGIIEICFWLIFLLILNKIRKMLGFNSLFLGAIVILLPVFISPILLGGNMTEEYALPFIAYGNYYLLKISIGSEIKKHENFLLGFSAGAAFFLKPNTIAVFIICGLALSCHYWLHKKAWRGYFQAVSWGFLGAAAVLVPFVLYFYFSNALHDMFFCIWTVNYNYAKTTIPLYKLCVKMIHRVVQFYYYLFVPCCIVSIFAVFGHRKKYQFLYLFFSLNVFLTVFTCVFARSMYGHYCLVMVPCIVVLSGLSYDAIKNNKEILNKVIVLSCAVLLCLPLVVLPLLKVPVNAEIAKAEHELAEFILKKTYRRDKILILGNQCPLYHKLKLNPTFKYIYQTPPIFYDADLERDFLKSIVEQEYDLIIKPIDFFSSAVQEHSLDPDNKTLINVHKAITNFYVPVFSNKKYLIYDRVISAPKK